MREAVIVASSRTPLAKSFRGSFNLTRPDDLAAHCITDVLGKVPQLDPTEIEDVILGCGQPHGPAGHNVARVARDPRRPAGDRRRARRSTASAPRACRPSRWPRTRSSTKARTRRSAAASRASRMMQRDSDPNPWVEEHKPGHLHGDGRHGRGRRQALQDQPRGAGRVRAARASSAPRGPSRRASSRKSSRRCRSRAASSTRRPARSSARRTTTSTRTSATAPTPRSRGCWRCQPHFDTTSGQGTRHGRQLLAALRRRLGHAADVARTAPRRSASSRSSSSAASPSPAASRTRWASARCSRCRSCSSAHGLKVDDIDVWELNEAFAVAGRLLPRPARHRPWTKLNVERRLDRDRPSVRHDRLAHGRHHRQRDAAPQGALRRRDDVRRRRPGRGGAVRVLSLVSTR